MKNEMDILSALEADLPKPPRSGQAAARRRKQRVKAYSGVGLKTYRDSLGNEIPLPMALGVIRRAPALLREVAELWSDQGPNIMAQQFTALHAVVGAVLDGCYVRQQENTYMLNLQVMIVGGAGAGKSRVALLDRLVEPIDRELRLAHRRRMEDYQRAQQRHALELAAWKQAGGKGDPPLPPTEPLPRSLMLADATTQAALVRWLAGNDGHLSLMRHDELSTLKHALDNRCGAFGDILKKAFDNGKHEKQLRTADEGYYIRRVGLATVFSTTPGVLKDFIGSYEDGMGSRIIGHFTASEPRFDHDLDPDAMALFNTRIEALAQRVEELWRALAAAPPGNSGNSGISGNSGPSGTPAPSGIPSAAEGGYFLALSDDQQARFVRHFKYLMQYYVALDDLGEEAVPIIRRRDMEPVPTHRGPLPRQRGTHLPARRRPDTPHRRRPGGRPPLCRLPGLPERLHAPPRDGHGQRARETRQARTTHAAGAAHAAHGRLHPRGGQPRGQALRRQPTDHQGAHHTLDWTGLRARGRRRRVRENKAKE